MAQVRLNQVTRRFKETTAIADISFTVKDGEFWAIVGPSGCGKSTLLRIVAGLETATAGEIYIGDRCVTSVPARQRDVAMVFQNYALYPHMSVAENMAFGLRLQGMPKSDRRDRVNQVAKALNIEPLLERKPGQLSGGQQQRVALGRALARSPQVFLLDEPLSNLDAQLRDEIRGELKHLHQQFGITTLYVTHDQIEAMTLADQIVVLDGGCIQQIGSPQFIYQHPKNQMVATFLGSPPMNILAAQFKAGQLVVGAQPFPCPDGIRQAGLIDGQPVQIGIRPEHLRLCPKPGVGFQVSVAVVEPLGRELLVRTELLDKGKSSDPRRLNWVAPMAMTVEAGDRLTLTVDPDALFLFDADTGNRLYPSPLED
ncbi:MAG: ABC transporter ATP-binding protein [Cyanobacteria bacterium P01_D01_bin.128]